MVYSFNQPDFNILSNLILNVIDILLIYAKNAIQLR